MKQILNAQKSYSTGAQCNGIFYECSSENGDGSDGCTKVIDLHEVRSQF